VRYIERCREDGELAPKSVDTYEATIEAVRATFAGIRISEAAPGLLDEILKDIRRDHGATRERHTKVALNSVLTEAVLASAIAANPVRELAARRKQKADKKPRGAPGLDVKQVRGLLAAIAESEVCDQKDLRDPVIDPVGRDWVAPLRAVGAALAGRRAVARSPRGTRAAGCVVALFRRTVATLVDDSGLSARVGTDQLGPTRRCP
jgi:hypothetical protein